MKRLKMIKLFREAGSTRPELDAEVEELLTSSPLFAELSRRAYLEVVRTMTRVSMDRERCSSRRAPGATAST